MKSKLRFRVMIFVALLVMIVSTAVFASGKNAQQGSTVTVPSSENIEGTSFYAGNIVTVDANINGTTFIAGNDVTINGDVEGDLFIAGNKVNINGNVNGNVYGAGSIVSLAGKVEKDAFLAGESVQQAEGATIGRDVNIGANNVTLNAEIGRHVNIGATSLTAGEGMKIAGNLNAEVEVADKPNIESKVSGETKWKAPAATAADRQEMSTSAKVIAAITGIILSTLSGLFLWGVIRVIKPRYWKKNRIVAENNILKSMGIGLLAIIVIPIVAIILLITVIGVPTSIIGMLLFMIALYIAKIIVAEVIGSKIIKERNGKELHYGVWGVLLGLVILNVLSAIPYIGILVSIATVLLGFGAIILRMYEERKQVVTPNRVEIAESEVQ